MAKPTQPCPGAKGAIEVAIAQLRDLALSAQSERAILLSWERFLRYVVAGRQVQTVVEIDARLVAGFVRARRADGAAPSVSTMHWRRSSLRLLFRLWREVELVEGDPTLDLELPAKSHLSARALTDDEVALCRWAALGTVSATRLPAIWALAEAGASSGEIPRVTVGDVRLDAGVVRLPGSAHTDARVAPLGTWTAQQLRRHLDEVGEDRGHLHLYNGAGRPESMQASISGAVGAILQRAGLHEESDVRPRSVTAWAGQRVFDETGRIEDVARRLGLRSLDRAAALIGWQWHAV